MERTLPLLNHPLELVVKHQGLHSDAELARCLEFHGGHAETGVAVDIDDGLVRSGNFRANGCWQTEAHGLHQEKKYVSTAIWEIETQEKADVHQGHHWSPYF